jgi:hypothetical protein
MPPAKLSCEFPYAGYYVMRSGWEPDAKYLLFDAGPFGYGHQHEDKLTLVAAAYGKVHLIDVGNYPYDTSQWRKYAIDTFAHNTVLVDGQPQRRRGEKDRWSYVVKDPQAHTFFTNDGYDIASGTYDEGYGDEKKKLATHNRQVIFVKREPREYWVVTDTLTPPEKDKSPHTYYAMFHLDAPEINLDPKSLSVVTKNKPGESNFVIAAMVVPGLSVTNQAGQEKPFVQGWVREGSYGMRKIPTPVYHLEAVGPAKMIFVLYPVRPDEKPPSITVTSAQPLRIRFGDRGVDRIEPTSDPSRPLRISHDN